MNKKQYFLFWTEKCFSANRDEELLENYLKKWKKMISTIARKSVSTSKNNFCQYTALQSRRSRSLTLFCLRPATLLKKETLVQVFSCEFCEIFKNTFFYRTPPVAASVSLRKMNPLSAQFISGKMYRYRK